MKSLVVTREDIFHYGACRTARMLFDEHYPSGSVEYQELIDALETSNLRQADEYVVWLTYAYEDHALALARARKEVEE